MEDFSLLYNNLARCGGRAANNAKIFLLEAQEAGLSISAAAISRGEVTFDFNIEPWVCSVSFYMDGEILGGIESDVGDYEFSIPTALKCLETIRSSMSFGDISNR